MLDVLKLSPCHTWRRNRGVFRDARSEASRTWRISASQSHLCGWGTGDGDVLDVRRCSGVGGALVWDRECYRCVPLSSLRQEATEAGMRATDRGYQDRICGGVEI